MHKPIHAYTYTHTHTHQPTHIHTVASLYRVRVTKSSNACKKRIDYSDIHKQTNEHTRTYTHPYCRILT